jgi:hypothetical protein
MKRLTMGLMVAVLPLFPGAAWAGSSTDAALALGSFAVFNQIIGGTGLFAGFAPAPRPVYYAPPPPVVYYAPPPAVVYAPPPPPVYVAPPPVYYVTPRPVYLAPQPVVVYQTPRPVYYKQKAYKHWQNGRGWDRRQHHDD